MTPSSMASWIAGIVVSTRWNCCAACFARRGAATVRIEAAATAAANTRTRLARFMRFPPFHEWMNGMAYWAARMIQRTDQLVNNNFVGEDGRGGEGVDQDPNGSLSTVGSMTNDASAAPTATVMNSIAVA